MIKLSENLELLEWERTLFWTWFYAQRGVTVDFAPDDQPEMLWSKVFGEKFNCSTISSGIVIYSLIFDSPEEELAFLISYSGYTSI